MEIAMCDYSLANTARRDATAGESLVSRVFGGGTRGFCSPQERNIAVCLCPGTELGFKAQIKVYKANGNGFDTLRHTTAVFDQVDKNNPNVHHDVLRFSDGTWNYVHNLVEGQWVDVLQLPANPATLEGNARQDAEEHQRPAVYV